MAIAPVYAPEIIRLLGDRTPPVWAWKPPDTTASERRAAKPRMPLGQPQKRPPGCRACGGQQP